MDNHILITGTGRSGTSLLMQILTELNLDTGFKKGYRLDPRSNAGMEVHLKNIDHWHYIVKNPEFCFEIPLIAKEKIIDHVFICVRDPWEVVLSREINQNQGTTGSFWYAHDKQEQTEANDLAIHTLIHNLASYDIDHTLIYFDDMVSDPEYLFQKLYSLFLNVDYNEEKEEVNAYLEITWKDFLEVYNRLVDKSKIKVK